MPEYDVAPVVKDELPMTLEGVVHTARNSERNSPSCAMQYLYNQREVQALPLRNGGRSFEEAQAKMEMSLVIGVTT